MSLNPVQFGTEVIDQFGRYLMTTFPIADREMEDQVRRHLRHDVGGERMIAKGPYVYLTRPFEQGPSVATLCQDQGLGLHPALAGVFPFGSVHKHQELALRAIKAGKHVVVATGTGSGKTEAFLLPIIDHALHLRDQRAPDGVTAVIVYPMNALADDQLRRLRPVLAGTGVTFGRYTGVTPDDSPAPQGRLKESRCYTPDELKLLGEGKEEEVPVPFEECFHRQEIRARRPRILLTNYSQLEYLLLRDKDLDLFRGAPLRFLVFDEVHTYTGALGSEVACLIRRLRYVARKQADEVICIGTSATVQENESHIDAESATLTFTSRLFGVDRAGVQLVTEHYRRPTPAETGTYVPRHPADARALLDEVLEASRELQLQEEVHDLTPPVLALVEKLCGKPAPAASTSMERAWMLLAANKIVSILGDLFKSPLLMHKALPRLRVLDRKEASEDALVAELLCYMTLGALVQKDGEPILRPRLHYFVQGYHGLGCSLSSAGKPTVHFDIEAGHDKEGAKIFPFALCRSCGQHYFRLFAGQPVNENGVGVTTTRVPGRDAELGEGESLLYATNALVGRNEDEADDARPTDGFLCRTCGTIQDRPSASCLNAKCRRAGPLVGVVTFRGEMKTCLACGTSAKGYEEIVTPARSSEVADVTIQAQSMLAAMHEEPLQKLLIFTDNRQDAAFQAGWMEERSRRFRLRHLLFAALQSEPETIWSLEKLTDHMVDAAKDRGILKPGVWDDEDNRTRVRWFLLEEFASTGQRRNALESLALVEVLIHGIAVSDAPRFFTAWAERLDVTTEGVSALVRLILDYYRRRGLVSDPLLARRWTDRDVEVRKGLVSTHDQYRPHALVFSKERDSGFTMGWTARNGRSGPQEIFRKGIPGGDEIASSIRTTFLEELWHLLLDAKHQVLQPVTLTHKWGGKQVPLDIPGGLYQIDAEKLGFRLTDHRQICPACRRTQAVRPPTGACPEYACKGQLAEAGRDEENFDVHQYTQTRFVPLKAWEHSAQVPKHQRQMIEREFKRERGGLYNCLVCTPTLELGVDIGKLEMVLMRNAPPTPANYAQRAGRAGRRHRIAVVFTYCRDSAHGQYFFTDPRSMIAGEIRVPAFSMRNEPLIRKHAHSAILTALREHETSREVLDRAFPPFIWRYFSEAFQEGEHRRHRYLRDPPDLSALGVLVKGHRPALFATLKDIFQLTWPVEQPEDVEAVTDAVLGRFIDDFQVDLQAHVQRLFSEVQSYLRELQELRRREDEGLALSEEEETRRRRLHNALRTLTDEKRQESYTLSYLGADGFFPGYALARDSVTSQCLEPYLELSRPAAVALRELTPANSIYANKNIFRVRKLNFHKVKGEDQRTVSAVLQRTVAYDREHERVFDAESISTEGGHAQAPIKVGSYLLTDVEMRSVKDIDDRERDRRKSFFKIYGHWLAQHAGGREGKIGSYDCRFLRRQRIRLVNLGQPQKADPGFSLFPLCTVCGATRSPSATEGELEQFAADHKKLHGRETTGSYALHVELTSDTLHLGPFPERALAVNLFESLRIGARLVLDMGTTEIEAFTTTGPGGGHWAILYDPMPGGSGFLPQLVGYWETICQRAADALERCASQCEEACYSCLKHFRNQMDHDQLNRHTAINLLAELTQPLTLGHQVPAVVTQAAPDGDKADSQAEVSFAQICEQRGFPVPPVSQHRVGFDDGSYTDADFAYPDKKVLVFIDGMGRHLHGDPERRRRDRLLRAKARMKGWQVVEITAEALQDSGSLAVHLEELALFLGVSG
jgi:ATP-dependent helicase YprA (DUF1998 family)